MAFSVYEVVRVAYQSRSWFVLYAQLRDRRATRTTSLILKAMQERNLCSLGNHYDPEMLAMKVSVHFHIVTAIITVSKKQIKKRHIVA